MADTPTAEAPWLTLREAAERSGLDREAIRSRARRGLIPKRMGNRGEWLVQLPAELVTEHDQAMTENVTRGDGAIADLQSEVTELRVALARAETERDAAKAVAMAEIAAKDALLGELRLLLADARRPFWRRWLG